MDGCGRHEHGSEAYGSEGWGFEFSRACNTNPFSRLSRYEFVLKHEDTQGRYSMIDMVLSPTFDSSPGHSHREHSETFYMVSGEMEWTVEGESHILGPGDLVYIPPFAHHIARAVGGESPRALLIWEPAGWEVGMA